MAGNNPLTWACICASRTGLLLASKLACAIVTVMRPDGAGKAKASDDFFYFLASVGLGQGPNASAETFGHGAGAARPTRVPSCCIAVASSLCVSLSFFSCCSRSKFRFVILCSCCPSKSSSLPRTPYESTRKLNATQPCCSDRSFVPPGISTLVPASQPSNQEEAIEIVRQTVCG